MSFKKFKEAVSKQLDKMVADGGLFITATDKDTLWSTYLDSFPAGTNELFRERREHDCSACKQFIRNIGTVVSIRNNKIVSIWDGKFEEPYATVAKEMSKLVHAHAIQDIFLSREKRVGLDSNHEMIEDTLTGALGGGSPKVRTWEHLCYVLPSEYVNTRGDSIESVQGTKRDTKNVFKRSLDELTVEAADIVLDLIAQGSLYRGEEHKRSVEQFLKAKKEYDKVAEANRDAFCWVESQTSPVGRIRNTAIGTLLIDLSNNVELDEAVTKFEKVMAPTNYKRPKALFTKKMVEDAQNKVRELGFEESLARRQATLEDITVNNVIFLNRDDAKVSVDVFEELSDSVAVSAKKLGKVDEVTMDEFINDIVPRAESIEILVENRHNPNFVSLVAPQNKQAPSMLKWDNNFSWSYNGDVTDSLMKQNVKNAGGKVDGILRFSIQWNENDDNFNDFDAHCREPGGFHIYYGDKKNNSTGGNLDVDIINPDGVAVENITWPDEARMQEGDYELWVNNYSHRGGRSGFRAEVEFGGQIFSFDYNKNFHGDVKVATVRYTKTKGFEMIKSLDGTTSVREVWGVKTNTFVPVSSMMFSPNYWDGQEGTGNKHYMFFLKGCHSESTPRGFYNEFLKGALTPHRKVFEALSGKMKVEEADNHLAGLGFSSTQKAEVIARVSGSFTRTLKIKV